MEKEHKIRLFALWFFMVFFWGVLIWQFFVIQILKHSLYSSKAKQQYYQEEEISASRGLILDRNKEKLATDLQFYSYGANPGYVADANIISSVFAKSFPKNSRYYLNRLTSKKSFVWLEQKVGIETAEQIGQIKDPGLVTVKSFQRYYPHGPVGGQLIGFTNTENTGISGIEKGFNPLLRGLDGKIIFFADGKRKEVTDITYPKIDPVSGTSIVLTIDLIAQTVVEEELAAAAEKYKAKSAVAVLLQPKTGEVLAMASYPQFNPNNHSNMKFDAQRIKAITDTYEPGSIFKLVSAAAILEEHALTPEDTVFCEYGRYRLNKRVITDHEPFGKLSFQEVFEHSSNIGTAKSIHKIPAGTYFQYIRNFGFGCETGIQLPGEVKGVLRNPSEWSLQSQGSISYGYEIGVTPLQMASAYAAVANDGVLMQPVIIKEIIDNRGNTLLHSEPTRIRRVISKRTAQTLKDFLKGTVERGTGKNARAEGLHIGGKTGTARRLNENGHYTNKYLASFAGVWPIEDPQFVCVIMIVEPVGSYYGGSVAAPVLKNIAERLDKLINESLKNPAEHYYVNGNCSSPGREIPDFRTLNVQEAFTRARILGLNVIVRGSGSTVGAQHPPAGEKCPADGNITFVLKKEKSEKRSLMKMPDLVGLSMRDAINMMKLKNINFSISGTGTVAYQSARAGAAVGGNNTIEIVCKDGISN